MTTTGRSSEGAPPAGKGGESERSHRPIFTLAARESKAACHRRLNKDHGRRSIWNCDGSAAGVGPKRRSHRRAHCGAAGPRLPRPSPLDTSSTGSNCVPPPVADRERRPGRLTDNCRSRRCEGQPMPRSVLRSGSPRLRFATPPRRTASAIRSAAPRRHAESRKQPVEADRPNNQHSSLDAANIMIWHTICGTRSCRSALTVAPSLRSTFGDTVW